MKPLLLTDASGTLVVVTRPFTTSPDHGGAGAKTRLWFGIDDFLDVRETVEQVASAVGANPVGGRA